MPLYFAFFLIVCLSVGFFSSPSRADQPAAAPANPTAAAQADPAYPLVQKAVQLLQENDTDGAATLLDKALALNPHSVSAHVLRGSMYASKRLLPQAEEQFTLAEADAPTDIAIQFFLADIKMSEGDYEQARTLYAALENTPGREDFVAYKVFLCDLMGNRQDRAGRELAAFKQSPVKPSYYFANAAWCVTQHDSASAKKLLDTAAAAFTQPENAPYAQALQNLSFLPLPAN